MRLLELPQDVLVNILQFCDTNGLLCLERTCPSLTSLISSYKCIWTSAFVNALPEHRPHITPHEPLDFLTTSDLRELAVRGVERWNNWQNFPEPRDTRMLSSCIGNGRGNRPVYMMRMLPCMCHLLVQRLSRLECWDMKEKCVVWKYGDGIGRRMPFFSVDLVDRNLVMMARAGFALEELVFQILQLDMTTMRHEVVFEKSTIPHRPIAFLPMISGDFALVSFCDSPTIDGSKVMLVNWKKGQFIYLQVRNPKQFLRSGVFNGIGLSKMCLVYLSEDGCRLNVTALGSIMSLWADQSDLGRWSTFHLPDLSEISVSLPSLFPYKRGLGQRIRILTHFTIYPPTWCAEHITTIFLVVEERGLFGTTYSFRYHCELTTSPSGHPVALRLHAAHDVTDRHRNLQRYCAGISSHSINLTHLSGHDDPFTDTFLLVDKSNVDKDVYMLSYD